MAKVNQRLWKVPGQRAKRKAWGYTVQVVEDGERVQKRCYKSEWTKEDAEQALAALLLGIEEAKPATPADGPSLDEYADKWLINIEGNVGDRAWADQLEAARAADSARRNARASKVATGR